MNIKAHFPTIILSLVGVVILGYVTVAFAASSGFGEGAGFFQDRTLIVANTSSATSSGYRVAGARAVTLVFSSDGPNGSGTGTTTFSVEGSVDGTTYYDYNMLVSNVANTNAQDLTRVATVDITGTSTSLYFLPIEETPFQTIRCISVEAGTTTATCSAFVQY